MLSQMANKELLSEAQILADLRHPNTVSGSGSGSGKWQWQGLLLPLQHATLLPPSYNSHSTHLCARISHSTHSTSTSNLPPGRYCCCYCFSTVVHVQVLFYGISTVPQLGSNTVENYYFVTGEVCTK
jgi:hypothetical protein